MPSALRKESQIALSISSDDSNFVRNQFGSMPAYLLITFGAITRDLINMKTTSYWSDSVSLPRFKTMDKNHRVDVAIIGGGITGITAAYLFKKAGCKVALIERGRLGGFDTVNTTAHITCVTDT